MIDLTKDTFCLGGHEFQSRFILGSGKYSLELIKAAVENAGARLSHLHCAVQIRTVRQIYLTIFRKV